MLPKKYVLKYFKTLDINKELFEILVSFYIVINVSLLMIRTKIF